VATEVTQVRNLEDESPAVDPGDGVTIEAIEASGDGVQSWRARDPSGDPRRSVGSIV